MPWLSSRVRGSVITPVSAAAAAVSGEHSHTESSSVPERPGKFRGMVRRELRPVAGACPIPMQPMQPDWWIRAPAATREVSQPPVIRSASTSREVGLMSRDTPGAAWRPSRISATTAKSRSPGFAEEPTTTCETSSPATDATGTTFPGEEGRAISGSRAVRSMCSVRS